MTRMIIRWALLALSVFVASTITGVLGLGFAVDVSTVSKVMNLFLGVAILSLLNATLGKIIKFFTLPISCVTLGLFSLVVNALMLFLAAQLQLGFKITQGGLQGFFAAFVASILISFINGVLGVFLPDLDKKRKGDE